jgi:hypothetical protein
LSVNSTASLSSLNPCISCKSFFNLLYVHVATVNRDSVNNVCMSNHELYRTDNIRWLSLPYFSRGTGDSYPLNGNL